MGSRSRAPSIEKYIAGFPAATQAVLEELRALIRSAAPGATETMSYAIPTFDLGGRHIVHFAGYQRHVGLYPSPAVIQAFSEELRPYPTAKGTVRFSLDKPLPRDLIARMVQFRVQELGASTGGSAAES